MGSNFPWLGGPELHKKKKASWIPAFLTLCFFTVDAHVTMLKFPDCAFPTMMDGTLKLEANTRPCLPSIASVRDLVTRKAANTVYPVGRNSKERCTHI